MPYCVKNDGRMCDEHILVTSRTMGRRSMGECKLTGKEITYKTWCPKKGGKEKKDVASR